MRGKVGSGSTAFNLDRFLILHRQPQDVWSKPPGLRLMWIRTNRHGSRAEPRSVEHPECDDPEREGDRQREDRDQPSFQFLSRIRSDGGLADT
jgi:hypothetical protein